MTSGDKSGMDRLFWRALPLFALAVVVLNTLNTFTDIQDNPAQPPLYAAITQATSALTVIAFLWVPWLAYRTAPIDSRPRWRAALVHVAGLLVFSVLHVVGFYLLRIAVFRLLGLPYEYDLGGRFIYELRKDAFGYVLGTVAFWGLTQIYGRPRIRPAEPPATFDIRDGAKVIRTPVAEILAVASAGNYVEFHLADGRKPLMRAALSATEAELAPMGLIRTHRSWLVNAARVTELRPEKSGDYVVCLGELEAPLSRRFPAALARLRAG